MRLTKDQNFKVPWDGYYINKLFAAQLVANQKAELDKKDAEIKTLRSQIILDVANARAICVINTSSLTVALASCDGAQAALKDTYEKATTRIVSQCEPGFWDHPMTNFISGVAVCGASVGLGITAGK